MRVIDWLIDLFIESDKADWLDPTYAKKLFTLFKEQIFCMMKLFNLSLSICGDKNFSKFT